MLGPVAGRDLWGLYRGAEVFAHPEPARGVRPPGARGDGATARGRVL
jgi:hypothetical protein